MIIINEFKSNYFHVRNPKEFEQFMRNATFTNDTGAEIFWQYDNAFAFGVHSHIRRMINPKLTAVANNFGIPARLCNKLAFDALLDGSLDKWMKSYLNANYYDNDYDDYDTSAETFYNYLKTRYIMHDDAVIIIDISDNFLNHATAKAHVITEDNIRHIDLVELALDTARKNLNNPDWKTQL